MTDQRPSGEREWEITTNTYIFAGVGAVILGGLAYASLGGVPNTIAAAVVGALAGGALGLFFNQCSADAGPIWVPPARGINSAQQGWRA